MQFKQDNYHHTNIHLETNWQYWSETLVISWIKSIGLSKDYSNAFEDQKFTINELMEMDEADLTCDYHFKKEDAKKLIRERDMLIKTSQPKNKFF